MRDGKVVKGVRFRNHRIVGDILDLARRYCDEGADELVFYDITASPDGRSVDRGWGSQIRSYFLHPDQRVKYARTGYMAGSFHSVLYGNIQGFLDAYLRSRAEKK